MHSKPWRLTHCGGMGTCFEKCWIIIPNIHPLWIIECYYGKGGLIWKGENELSPSGEMM
jgi:hypothetical protein